jgi:hypothetical protein
MASATAHQHDTLALHFSLVVALLQLRALSQRCFLPTPAGDAEHAGPDLGPAVTECPVRLSAQDFRANALCHSQLSYTGPVIVDGHRFGHSSLARRLTDVQRRRGAAGGARTRGVTPA